MRHFVPALLVIGLLGCRPPPVATTPQQPTVQQPSAPGGPKISWARVTTATDLPPAPVAGAFRVHMIDVGTGLAILIQGPDFSLLYDAGTNDRDEKPLRVVAYLASVLGASGDDQCIEPGTQAPTSRRTIDHVVLSHPHLDHASALELVLHCYDVKQVWDSGRINEAVFYREFLAAVGKSTAVYRTAATVPERKDVTVKGFTITIPTWERFSEGDAVTLGEGARFTILHANPNGGSDMNQSSVVLKVELGRVTMLLVGDAESGPRKDPSYPVGDVEEFLIEHHLAAIRADILQVGHHGSMTSSRRGFLDAVKPSIALVSAGPKKYGTRTLPDVEVLDALKAVGATVLRTDENDAGCPIAGRIGGDKGPGGCDSWVITIDPADDPPPLSR